MQNNRYKISFFITTLGGGGAERVLCNLASFLSAEGNYVDIYVLRGNDRKYELAAGVQVHFLQPEYYEKKGLFYRAQEIQTVRQFLKELNGDVLISFLELPVLLSLLFKNKYDVPLIICERSDPKKYSKLYQKLYQKYAYRAEGCVCQTNTIKAWYDTVRGENVVIPNAIDEKFQDAPLSSRTSKNIVTMGRLTPEKNQKILIKAFAMLPEQYQDYHLIIYGQGPLLNELKNLSIKQNVVGKVHFPGYTNNVIEQLKDANIFVLSSDYEGMPNALAEAMAMGIPCVSTDCSGGGARELIDDGVNGILVRCGDSHQMERKIQQLLDNPSQANKLGQSAVKIRYRLSAKRIYHEWELYIKKIVESERKF